MLETPGIFSIPGGVGSSPGSATSPLLLLCGSGAGRGCCCAGKGFPGITAFPLHPFPPLSVALLRKPFSCHGTGWQRGLVASPPLPEGVWGGSQNRIPGKGALFTPKFGVLEDKMAVPESWEEPPEGCGGSTDALAQLRLSSLSVMFGQLQLGCGKG